jgi:hypothetical protein
MRISPIHAAQIARSFFVARFNMRRFAAYTNRRFRGDPRYDLQAVADGFLSRIDESDDDSQLLHRICEAYIKAVSRQQFAPAANQPTGWWQQARQGSLKPFVAALLARNIGDLRKMYRNFYRDPCSSGLLGAPYGMTKAYFGGTIKDVHRKFYLGHVLCRLDYWMEQTKGRFAVRELAGPGIGNPFGVVIDGTHIAVGAEYAHYCARRIDDLLEPETKVTVAEVGGGFGGMAYYLLRDRLGLTYLDFDAPERIALTAYYLLKAFPKLKFSLYGEGDLTRESLAQTDVALMPAQSLADMPAGSVDVTFSSHSMSKAATDTIVEYLRHIDRMTSGLLLCMAERRGSELISGLIGQRFSSFKLTETRSSGWHSYKVSGAGVGGARRVTDSTVFEQLYMRQKFEVAARIGAEQPRPMGSQC